MTVDPGAFAAFHVVLTCAPLPWRRLYECEMHHDYCDQRPRRTSDASADVLLCLSSPGTPAGTLVHDRIHHSRHQSVRHRPPSSIINADRVSPGGKQRAHDAGSLTVLIGSVWNARLAAARLHCFYWHRSHPGVLLTDGNAATKVSSFAVADDPLGERTHVGVVVLAPGAPGLPGGITCPASPSAQRPRAQRPHRPSLPTHIRLLHPGPPSAQGNLGNFGTRG